MSPAVDMGAPTGSTMRALRWYGPRDLRLEEVPLPQPGPGQVLVAVERTGLCGSDLEEYREGPVSIPSGGVPLVLGHEVVGTVVRSDGVGPAVGTRVVPDVVVGCGSCWWCRRHEPGLCPHLRVRGQQQDGGLADFMVAEAATCIEVPAGMDSEVACFAEPAAVAVRAVRKAGDLAGATVAVLGGGTIGNLVAQVALASSCASVVVIDPLEQRRELADRVGAFACGVGPEATALVRDGTGGRGADVVVECSGVQSGPAEALKLSRRGACVVLVGFRGGEFAVPWLDVVLHERVLLGSAAHVWDVDVAGAMALLARGVVDPRPLHSATIGLDAAAAGFARLDADPTITKLMVRP